MISSSATNAACPTVVDPNRDGVPSRAARRHGAGRRHRASSSRPSTPVRASSTSHDNQEYAKGLAERASPAATANGNPTRAPRSINPKDDIYSVGRQRREGRQAPTSSSTAATTPKPASSRSSSPTPASRRRSSAATARSTMASSTPPARSAEGAVISCPCNLATRSATGKPRQVRQGLQGGVQARTPGTYSSEAFDAANILMNGIKAGNTTRAKLLAYVEGSRRYDGISKTIEFEDNGNLKATDRVLLRREERQVRAARQHRQALAHTRTSGLKEVAIKFCTHCLTQISSGRRHVDGVTHRGDLCTDRPGLHARVRRPPPYQLRPLGSVHGGHLRLALRDPCDRLSTRPTHPRTASAWRGCCS